MLVVLRTEPGNLTIGSLGEPGLFFENLPVSVSWLNAILLFLKAVQPSLSVLFAASTQSESFIFHLLLQLKTNK